MKLLPKSDPTFPLYHVHVVEDITQLFVYSNTEAPPTPTGSKIFNQIGLSNTLRETLGVSECTKLFSKSRVYLPEVTYEAILGFALIHLQSHISRLDGTMMSAYFY